MRIGIMLASGVLATGTTLAQSGNGNYLALGLDDAKAYWKVVEKGERISLPKSAMRKNIEGCVSVGFSIEADGKTANLVVLRSGFTNQADKQVIREVEQRVLRNFSSTRWAAADSNPGRTPVYTYGTFSFSLFERPALKSDVDERSDFIKATCEIADFPAAVARGDLVRKTTP